MAISEADPRYRILALRDRVSLMPMPVVDIRNVGMGMRHGRMVVGMHMRLLAIPVEIMLVLVMGVVGMLVCMIHR